MDVKATTMDGLKLYELNGVGLVVDAWAHNKVAQELLVLKRAISDYKRTGKTKHQHAMFDLIDQPSRSEGEPSKNP